MTRSASATSIPTTSTSTPTAATSPCSRGARRWRGHELEVTALGMGDAGRPRRARPLLRRRRPGPRAAARRARISRAKAEALREAVDGGAAAARRLRRLPAARPRLSRLPRRGHARHRPPPARDRRRRAADDRRRAARVRARARRAADARRLREPRRPHAARPRRRAARTRRSRASATTARAASRAAAPARVVGTYLHGPLLPRNPWLADWLLAQALAHRLGAGEAPRSSRCPTSSRAARTRCRPAAPARAGALRRSRAARP